MHLKTAWDYIRRSPFQAVAAIFVLSLTFFVTTMLAVLIYSSEKVLNYYETKPQIIAFLKDDAAQEDINLLRNKLQEDSRIKDINYVNKEQALEIYKSATVDKPLLSEFVDPSIFPASLDLSLTDLTNAETVIGELQNETVVEEVRFTASVEDETTLQEAIARLRKISYNIRLVGGAFVLFLTSTSFIVLLVIISMRMSSRKIEIEILDLIGATPGFIRSPIILEALIYAFLGVFFGWLISLLIVLYATPSLLSYFGEISILPSNTTDLLVIFGSILGIEIFIGFFLALIGSLIAVSRARKRR